MEEGNEGFVGSIAVDKENEKRLKEFNLRYTNRERRAGFKKVVVVTSLGDGFGFSSFIELLGFVPELQNILLRVFVTPKVDGSSVMKDSRLQKALKFYVDETLTAPYETGGVFERYVNGEITLKECESKVKMTRETKRKIENLGVAEVQSSHLVEYRGGKTDLMLFFSYCANYEHLFLDTLRWDLLLCNEYIGGFMAWQRLRAKEGQITYKTILNRISHLKKIIRELPAILPKQYEERENLHRKQMVVIATLEKNRIDMNRLKDTQTKQNQLDYGEMISKGMVFEPNVELLICALLMHYKYVVGVCAVNYVLICMVAGCYIC